MSDLVTKLIMDIHDWVEPIVTAQDYLADLEGLTRKSIGAIRQSFASLRAAKEFVAGKLTQIDEGEVPFKVLLGTVRDLNQKWQQETPAAVNRAIAAQAQAAHSTEIVSAAAQKAGIDVEALAASFSRKAVIAALAYKVGLDEVIAAGRQHLQANSEFRKSISGLAAASLDLANTLVNEVTGGLKASLMAVVQLGTGYTSLTDLVNDSAATITSWANSATAGIKTVKTGVQEAGLIFGTALAMFQGMSLGDAAQFYEQGRALNQMAEDTANVIAKQEQMRDTLGFIVDASNRAAAAQQTASEVARIAAIDNVEALDRELTNLKLREQSQDAAVTQSKAWQQQITQITAAIERQRAAIEGGTFKAPESAVDKQLAGAQQALDRLALGETDFAIATARAMGATDEQVSRLRAILTATKELTDAKKAQEEADRAAAEAQRAADARFEQGKDVIANLKDEIDLLTGAATKSEIATRDLIRKGFDESQIAEISRLTEELDKLKEGETPKSGKTDQRDNTAVLQGTSKAAELVVRGLGSPAEKDKTAKAALAEQKKTTAAVKGIKLQFDVVKV